jgi:23S rRNA pseudouridine1911/1915/1917 synthase
MYEKPPWREISVILGTSERLDCWLSRMVPDLSRRSAAAMIAKGAITMDGRRAAKSDPVRQGAVVAIHRKPPLAIWSPLPDASILVPVLFEDEQIAVVNKPPGVSSVPLDPDEAGTLAGAVVSMFKECACVGRRAGDGGLLQRLDKETSGAVMVARAQEIHKSMTKAQAGGGIEKRYLALVKGAPPETMRLNTPLAASGQRGGRMRPDTRGQPAITEVHLISTRDAFSLVEAVIRHGVRHQIRAHLAYAGYPIAGDPLYGEESKPAGLTRLFLHAHEVTFFHPMTNQSVTVRAPLPEELSVTYGGETSF